VRDEGKCGPLEQEQPSDVAGCRAGSSYTQTVDRGVGGDHHAGRHRGRDGWKAGAAGKAAGQDEAGQTGRDGEHTGKLDAGQRFADEHGSGDRDQQRRRAAGQRVDLAELTEPVRAHEQQVLAGVSGLS